MDHGGHTTTTIPRPRTEHTADEPRPDDTRFSDFTRPIAKERRLVKGRGKRAVIALGATVVAVALVGALFVFPVKAWLRQHDDIARKQTELDTLQLANDELQGEVSRLQTPDGVEEAARDEIGYVQKGEIRLTVRPGAAAPATLPTGWPYDVVAQIVSLRSAAAPPAP